MLCLFICVCAQWFANGIEIDRALGIQRRAGAEAARISRHGVPVSFLPATIISLKRY